MSQRCWTKHLGQASQHLVLANVIVVMTVHVKNHNSGVSSTPPFSHLAGGYMKFCFPLLRLNTHFVKLWCFTNHEHCSTARHTRTTALLLLQDGTGLF